MFSMILLITVQTTVYDSIYYWITGAFAFFGLASLLDLLRMKQLILTEKRLLLRWKFFPMDKEIFLKDINQIEEKDYDLTSESGGHTWIIHQGRKATVRSNTSRIKISFNSYETENYYVLVNKLKTISNNLPADFVGDPKQYGQLEQSLYGSSGRYWTLFMIALSIFLLYHVWKISSS